MKKILASILVLTMLVCCMSISAFAEDAPASFKVNDVTAKAGETIEIPVTIKLKEGASITAAEIQLTCDQFTINSITAGSWDKNDPEVNVGKGICGWMNRSGNSTAEGVFAVYTVTIDEDAEVGPCNITFVSREIVDYDENEYLLDGKTETFTLTIEAAEDDKPVHEHDFSGAWQKNDDGHWKECPTDGVKDQEAAHVYDDDADAICNVCEYEREVAGDDEDDKPVHGEDEHDEPTADTKYETNADEHWYVCSCGESVKGVHEYVEGSNECATCGYVNETSDDGDDKDDEGDKEDGDDKDDEGNKEEDKDETAKTGDNTNLFIYMAICLFAAAAIVVTTSQLKKNRG